MKGINIEGCQGGVIESAGYSASLALQY